MRPLPLTFYQSSDVVSIAKNLLGKALFTRFGTQTGGLIIETEAYAGVGDRASHAYSGRRTKRTEIMYGPGGRAYVYFCYGMHYLLNAVTAPQNIPHAVLIRAILPLTGIKTMMVRRKKEKIDKTLCNGPGAVCQALGITIEQNGWPLNRSPLVICDAGVQVKEEQIRAAERVGVGYAGPDASLPYRFQLYK